MISISSQKLESLYLRFIGSEIRRKIRRRNKIHAKTKMTGSGKLRTKFESLKREIQYSQRDIPIDLGRHHDQFFRHDVAFSCHRDERDSWRDAQVFSARHCSDTLSETLIRPRILLPFIETQRVTARHL